MQEITVAELKMKLAAGEDIQLVDVREPYEHEAYNIGGQLMPLSSLMEHADHIPTHKTVVMYCKKGIRSMIAIQRLTEKAGYTNLVNLKGGIDALPPGGWDNV